MHITAFSIGRCSSMNHRCNGGDLHHGFVFLWSGLDETRSIDWICTSRSWNFVSCNLDVNRAQDDEDNFEKFAVWTHLRSVTDDRHKTRNDLAKDMQCQCGGRPCNKYRGGTSDATTSASLIVPLFRMSFDDLLPSKTAMFVVRK